MGSSNALRTGGCLLLFGSPAGGRTVRALGLGPSIRFIDCSGRIFGWLFAAGADVEWTSAAGVDTVVREIGAASQPTYVHQLHRILPAPRSPAAQRLLDAIRTANRAGRHVWVNYGLQAGQSLPPEFVSSFDLAIEIGRGAPARLAHGAPDLPWPLARSLVGDADELLAAAVQGAARISEGGLVELLGHEARAVREAALTRIRDVRPPRMEFMSTWS